MANLSQIKTDSDWGLEASKINQNFNQVNTELTTLKNTTSVRQPLFSSTTEASKYITSPYVGQLVLIGSTIPAQIYRWNGSSWVDTGQTGGSAEVSLTNYYTKTDIDNQRAELESKIGGVGYITCETASGTAAKTITLTGLTALSTGIRLLVKMTNANTASNATLNINSLGAKPLYYNDKRVSTDNSWEAGDVIDVYFDGTNFNSSNVQGGSGSGRNLVLEWNTDVATTRKQVKLSDRKSLLQISYKDADGNTVNEQYIGTSFTDAEWSKDINWEQFLSSKSLDSTKEEINQTLEEFSKDFSPTDIEKDEIFEIGYSGSYWIEDALLSATDFSIFPDCYTGEIDDLSGKNNKLSISNLSSIDYSQSIAGIRGGELIQNLYNPIGNGISTKFTPPADVDVNLLTIEIYANIHANYWWNRKEIQNIKNPDISQSLLIFSNSYRIALNASLVKCFGSLSMDVLEVSHDNSFIDGALDAEIKNQYVHLVYAINNIDKTVKFYIDSKKVLELKNRSRLDSINIEYTLFYNWSANIKCVRFYNKELSQAEITRNYEATKNHYAL